MQRLAVSFCLGGLLVLPAYSRSLVVPHYAAGNGFVSEFVIDNPSAEAASGFLGFYDRNGAFQTLTFAAGPAQFLRLDIPPRGSVSFVTTGESAALKTGFAILNVENPWVTGLVIFRISGREASVFAVECKPRFCLHMERSNVLDTGVAVYRENPGNAVNLTLYDGQGKAVKSGAFPFSAGELYLARFFTEIFQGVPADFKGTLWLDSATPFAPVGLRFGPNVTSAIPVEENKSVSQVMAERFMGFWGFAPAASPLIARVFGMAEVVSIGQSPVLYYTAGVNQGGVQVFARYDEQQGQMRLTSPVGAYNEIYVFQFVDERTVTGCLHTDQGGTLSPCSPIRGLRVSPEPPQ
jgi:hypothetical protein